MCTNTPYQTWRVADSSSLHTWAAGERWCWCIGQIRLVRHIKNGLEIPGLKPALTKILRDFNLQVSLLDGCKTILDGDCADLAKKFYEDQTSGFFLSGTWAPRFVAPIPSAYVTIQARRYLRYAHYTATTFVRAGYSFFVGTLFTPPHQLASTAFEMRIGSSPSMSSIISGKITFTCISTIPFFLRLRSMFWCSASMVRSKIRDGCPVCHRTAEGQRA